MTFNSEFEKYAVKHRGISSNTLHTYASHLVTGLTPNIIEERPMNVAVMDVAVKHGNILRGCQKLAGDPVAIGERAAMADGGGCKVAEPSLERD